MEQFLSVFSTYTGLQPETLLLLLGVVVAVSNLLGRVIPDDAVGVLGVARKAAKVLGLYLSNRVAKGTSVNDVVNNIGEIAHGAVAAEVEAKVLPTIDSAVKAANPFKRAANGRFQKIGDDETGIVAPRHGLALGVFALGLVLLVTAGCTTTKQMLKTACNHQAELQQVIDAAQAALNQCAITSLPSLGVE